MKQYMLTPGPTMVPPEVLAASATPIIHHRSPDFTPIAKEVNEGLKYVFQTENPVLTFAASGTGAMESAIVNTCSPGDKVISIQGGKFGERWTELAEAYGLEPVVIDLPWGTAVTPEQVKTALKENPDAKAVYMTLCETSTGVIFDVKAIGEIVAQTDAILVVDAVSGLGAEKFYADEFKVDITVTGSQKALMLPPGLAFASVSEKARELIPNAQCPKYYFSYEKALKSFEKNSSPFTPAVSLLLGLQESLRMIKEEGLENIWNRHKRLAHATREGVKAIGLEIFSQAPSNVVTAIKVPESIDGAKIPLILRDEYGVTIAGGQEALKGKIIRIATLGYADTFDVITVIGALELALKQLGHSFEFGKGVATALRHLG